MGPLMASTTDTISQVEFYESIRELRRDIHDLQISTTRIETNLSAAQGNIAKLNAVADGFTWKLFLGVAVVIISQFVSKFIP